MLPPSPLLSDLPAMPLYGPLWPLLLRAGLTLLKAPQPFGSEPRDFCHQLPAPLSTALGAYQQFFTYSPDTVPLCFYYPLLQKAQLASMLQCQGLKVAGLIHLQNNLHAQQNLTPAQLCAGEPLQIQTRLSTMTQHKGLVLRAEQQLWQHRQLVLTGCSDYLLQKTPGQPAHSREKPGPIEPGPLICELQTNADAARAYARLSGDYNPIHLWRWSALLFGQPRPILHGMASAALLCRALPNPTQQLRLQFKTPVLPGIPLQLRRQRHTQTEGPSGDTYALWQQERLCLLASLHSWSDETATPDAD